MRTRSTATRPTCAWRPAPPRSSSRPASRRRGTSSSAGWAGCSAARCPCRAPRADGAVVVGTRESSAIVREHIPGADLAAVGDEGYVIRSVAGLTIIAGKTEVGALYGTFAFLRRIQTQQPIDEPRPRLLAAGQEPPPQQLGGHAAVLRQQRQRDRRPERRERDDLQLRRHRRQRRPQPAGDPRPLHRGRARDGVGRAQRHRDQPGQRQQRLPDATPTSRRRRRWPTRCARTASSSRSRSTTRRRPTRASRRTR